MAPRYYFISAMNVADHRRGGANICALAYLQAIAARAPGRVTLVGPLQRDRMPELPSGVDEVIEIPGRSSLSKAWHLVAGRSVDRLSPFLDRWIDRQGLQGSSIVFMNGSSGGRFSARLNALGVRTITLFHNVEADFTAISERDPLRRMLVVRAARWNDRLAFEHSAASIFLTGQDARVMRSRAVQRVSGALLAERGFFAPIPAPGDGGGLPASSTQEILVSCSLGLAQNLPGLMSFLDQWRIASQRSDLSRATVVLAGSSPSGALIARARQIPRVRVVADPSDSEMEALFASCRVCVSTIEAGSGIKVRVAEALRRGRPVVATPHSCIGYEAIDPRVVRSATIETMMPHLAEVIAVREPGLLERLAREEFERHLSFGSGSAALACILDRVEGSVRGRSA